MGLRDIEMTLPPGFRFYPSDEELVSHYLHNKVADQRFAGAAAASGGTLVEVDLHVHEPWELPDVAKLTRNEWYFFSFRDRKYATGLRTNRATKSGYWKATGKDRVIRNHRSSSSSSDSATIVGMRKTLVFYSGRAPSGIKSCWVMHEFRIENPHSPSKEDWVLCRVFYKNKVETEYSMDNEQEIITGGTTMKGYNYASSSSCHNPEYQSPPAASFPSLASHHYQLQPLSSHNHHNLSIDAFSSMPSLLKYENILDFSQNLDNSRGTADPRGNDKDLCCGVLMDQGLKEEHYYFDSLL